MGTRTITNKAVAHPMVREIIDLQVGNLTGWNSRQNPHTALRHVLEDFARKSAALALVTPAPRPNMRSAVWKRSFANDVEGGMIRHGFHRLCGEYVQKIKKKFPRLVGDRADFEVWCIRIAQHSGQVATMLLHRLDPALLMMTDHERFEEQMKLMENFVLGKQSAS